MVSLGPIDLVEYPIAYGRGWIHGRNQLRSDFLTLEAYGFGTFTPGAPNFTPEAREQCKIRIDHVANCVVNTQILGHSKGNNDAIMPALRERCGAIVKAAEDEDARWTRSYFDGAEEGRAEARRDLREGRLAVEVSEPPRKGDPVLEKMLRDRYQIILKRVTPDPDPKMGNKVSGRRTGYNEIADKEIERRFGKAAVDEVWNAIVQSPRY